MPRSSRASVCACHAFGADARLPAQPGAPWWSRLQASPRPGEQDPARWFDCRDQQRRRHLFQAAPAIGAGWRSRPDIGRRTSHRPARFRRHEIDGVAPSGETATLLTDGSALLTGGEFANFKFVESAESCQP
jgi:hypothetical protein